MLGILKIVGIIILVVAILYLLAIMPRMLHRPDTAPLKGRLYAHRGLHDNATDAPENSMAAFKKAVDANYGIELDVQLTKDKELVVFHDFTLKRVCGVEGKIADYTYEQLQSFSLCKSQEKIPKFSEVLELIGGKVPLIIEYKIPAFDPEVCPMADAMLANYDGVYCIESFNPLGVFWYRKNRPEIVRGFLSDNHYKEGQREFPRIVYSLTHNLLLNFLIKPDFIAYNHHYYKDLSRSICRYLYRALSVAWTIKSQEDLENRAGDFDLFIFDSFVPKKETK